MEVFNWMEVGSDSRRLGGGVRSETGKEAMKSTIITIMGEWG